MARLSLSDIWMQTRDFLQREGGLVFPLGLATLGMAMLVTNLVVPEPVSGQVRPGSWMIGMLPALILFLLGNVSISALVLIPAITVREAIRVAFVRLGTAASLLLGLAAAATAAFLVLAVVAVLIGAALGWGPAQVSGLAIVLALLPMIWLSVRLLLVWPHVAQSRDGPVDTVRTSFALTRGMFGRLMAATLLYLFFYILFTSAVQFALGSLLLLLGRVLGDPDLGRLLTAVLVSLTGAVLGTVWTVFVALLYRRATP